MQELILQENNFESMCKRAENIAAALYLITGRIPELESARSRIREISLDMVSLAVQLKDNIIISKSQTRIFSDNKVRELISLINISSVTGLISNMNADIVKKELEILMGQINDVLDSSKFEKTLISGLFFNDEVKRRENSENLPATSEAINQKYQDIRVEKSNRKDQRNKNILELVSKKGPVSIKDIASSIKGCSEKTVQRELNNLIKLGVIRKDGERRWTKYSAI